MAGVGLGNINSQDIFDDRVNEPKSEFCFSESSHSNKMLKSLDAQRQKGLLCDVHICVENVKFPCHKNVLAACSPYFLAMFTGEMKESLSDDVNISGIDECTMNQLLDFAYSSNVIINQENAQLLLSASNMLQMLTVRDACCQFLEKEMDPSNCLGIHCFAEAHNCSSLAGEAKRFILENFNQVAKQEELLHLPSEKLIEVIQSDDLCVRHEETVFKAVITWAKHEAAIRLPLLDDVLTYVRLPLVDPYFLFDMLDQEEALKNRPTCRALLDEAIKYYTLKDRLSEFQSVRAQPRRAQLTHSMLITIGGEIYNKNYLNNLDSFNFNTGKWTRLQDLPYPRCNHAAVVSEGKHIYIAGGFDKDKRVQNNVMRYEPLLDRWIKVTNLQTARARHGMAALDGCIYVVGGYDGQKRIDSVEKYSSLTNKWSQCMPMGAALNRCHAAGLGGYLYVAGGTTEPNNHCVDLFQRYNPRTDTWEQLTSMRTTRCLGGLVAVQGHIYAVGGTENLVRACKRLSRYDPATNEWTDLSEMKEPRFDAGVTAIGHSLFVLSGHDGENSFYNSVEEYDIKTDRWQVLQSIRLPYGRCRFGCVAMPIPDTVLM